MKKILLLCCFLMGLAATGQAQPSTVTDPAGKAKGLQKKLYLSEEQTEKITAIYQESAKKFDEIKAKDSGNTNKMLEDVRPLRLKTVSKIKAVLTKRQTAKYERLLKESGSKGVSSGWSDGWSSTGV